MLISCERDVNTAGYTENLHPLYENFIRRETLFPVPNMNFSLQVAL